MHSRPGCDGMLLAHASLQSQKPCPSTIDFSYKSSKIFSAGSKLSTGNKFSGINPSERHPKEEEDGALSSYIMIHAQDASSK